MTSILVISVAAILGLAMSNLAWARYTRHLRSYASGLQDQLNREPEEDERLTRTRAELVGITTRLQDIARGIGRTRSAPDSNAGCLERIEGTLDDHHRVTQVVRRQLSRTVDRLRSSQKELIQLREQMVTLKNKDSSALQAYLATVSSERDTLRSRIQELTKGTRRDVDTDRAQLVQTRSELEHMRFQLRAAYQALVELEGRSGAPGPEDLQRLEELTLEPVQLEAGDLIQ